MRVLFAVFPATAHLHPITPLAWALQNAGHQVRVVSPDVHRAFHAREEERRAEHRAQQEREQREREETKQLQKAAAWACLTRGRDVYPSDAWQSVPPGSDCTVCTSAKEGERQKAEERAAEEAQAKAEADAWRKENGIFGFLRR
ncbi:hypothetical protein [Streptomyces sp. NPDC002994]|uniref:hypothetical protein n=1 Tax=Streptomyces sp. NPDC002994 TaxID=3154441 RepID=UPI0033A2A1FB